MAIKSVTMCFFPNMEHMSHSLFPHDFIMNSHGKVSLYVTNKPTLVQFKSLNFQDSVICLFILVIHAYPNVLSVISHPRPSN